MKTDEIPFTFVTAIVLAGALIAVVSPGKPNATTAAPTSQAIVAHSVTMPGDNAATSAPATTEVEISE